jgi:hypothetical protein
VLDRTTLLRATAANHRAWFRRRAAAAGGYVERLDGLEVVVSGEAATVAFPGSRGHSRERLDEPMRYARERGVATMSCWSLDEDRRLGTLLLARGFEWGWQPHWMALEALGFGDTAALASLAVTNAELEEPVPGGRPPLAVAVVTGQAAVADWILERRPELASRPVEPRGGTLLHVALEWDDEHLVRVALRHGGDPSARDHQWNATPLEWARHLGRSDLAPLLEQPST